MKKKTKSTLGGLAIIVVAIAAYRYSLFSILHSRNNPSSTAAPASSLELVEETVAAPGFASGTSSLPVPTARPSTPPPGFTAYKNTQYGFSLYYPSDLQVSENNESAGAYTISFENANYSKGFEIFVTPYAERQVSRERFKMDEPSGVMQEPTSIVLDNAPATMFFGSNGVMGDTREVWFIKNGFLFEIATYKNADSWLSQIMATWQFTKS